MEGRPVLKVALQKDWPSFELNADFEFQQGILGVWGASGSGKTTLMRMLAGLEAPTGGTLQLNEDVLFSSTEGANVPTHLREVAYVFQDVRLFPHLTVSENILYGPKLAKDDRAAQFQDLMQLFDLEPLLSVYPQTLSGGEAQRVGIARALMCNPKLLLLDEPLASLDQALKDRILPYLDQLKSVSRVPMIYVSHDIREIARLADHLLILKSGQQVAFGTIDEGLSDPKLGPYLGAEALGSLTKWQVASHGEDGITELRSADLRLYVARVTAQVGSTLRVRIPASDVLISSDPVAGLSALNSLPGVVSEIHSGDGPGVILKVNIGEQYILARLTKRAVASLNLSVGQNCFAHVKALGIATRDVAG